MGWFEVIVTGGGAGDIFCSPSNKPAGDGERMQMLSRDKTSWSDGANHDGKSEKQLKISEYLISCPFTYWLIVYFT